MGKSISNTTTIDNRQAGQTAEGSLLAQGGSTINYMSSDSDVTKAALAQAREVAADSIAAQGAAWGFAREAQALVSGTSSKALDAVRANSDAALLAVQQAKTDAGQSERILKIVAVAAVVIGAAFMLKR